MSLVIHNYVIPTKSPVTTNSVSPTKSPLIYNYGIPTSPVIGNWGFPTMSAVICNDSFLVGKM
jgi:hypothetical protein